MAERPKPTLLRDAWRLVTPRREEGRPLSYGSGERALLYVLLSLVVIEGVGLYLLLKGTWFGLPIGIADVLSIPYVVGMIASTKAFPHLLTTDRLVLRSGRHFQVVVPLADVVTLRPQFRLTSGAGPALDGDRLSIPQGGSTNVEVTLVSPVETPLGAGHTVSFSVDEKHLRRLTASRGDGVAALKA